MSFMSKKPMLSIIVPVFRAEDSIEKLVESLEKQEFKDYELILINDFTEDEEHTIKTTEVIKKLQKKYKNIIRYDMPHTRYQGHARNEGIKLAKADYITFADSDDSYTSDYFETIVPYLKKGGFELLVFNAYKMIYEKNCGLNFDKLVDSEFIDKNGFQKFLKGEFAHKVGNTPWNKIYLKKIIDKYDIKNEFEKKTAEDLLFNIEYVGAIKKYKLINKPLYYYQLDIDVMKSREYRKCNFKEDDKFYIAIERIAKKYNIKDYDRYFGLFRLRYLPGFILNESNNKNYSEAKSNLKMYLTNEINKKGFKNLKIRDFDFKLWICYIIYKFNLSNLILYILYKRRHKNER